MLETRPAICEYRPLAFDKLKNLFNVDIKDGERGQAVVQSSSMPIRGRSYNVSMWLDVYLEGREPYRIEHECMVSATKHPWPGARLPVVVDRQNPKRIDIQWDELQTVDERMAAGAPAPAAGQGQQVIDLRGTPLGDELRAAVGAQGEADPADDRLAQLERLAKLRDSGALTQEEFDRQKAAILGG
jgi:Short C-terminal domain